MKFQKIVILLTFLCFVQISFGQTGTGRIQAGGGISGNFSIADSSSFIDLNPSVTFGYFISDHWVLRGGFSYSWSRRTHAGDVSTTDGFYASVGTRYYWSGERIQPFLGMYLHNSLVTINSFNPVNGEIRTIPGLYFAPIIDGGAALFLNENVAVELSLPVSTASYTWMFSNDLVSSGGNFRRIGITSRITLQVYLR